MLILSLVDVIPEFIEHIIPTGHPLFTLSIFLLLLQNDHMSDIKTSVLYVAGEPEMVMLDYLISNGNETR